MQKRLAGGLTKLLIRLSFCSLFVVSACAEAAFYVAIPGNDANPGTQDKPFSTLERARGAVRKLKQPGTAGAVTVWLGVGDYPRSNAFELTSADSGSSDAPM